MITVLPDKTVFDSPGHTIVNTVNCVGVMGKGLALAVKKRYPEVFERYLAACDSGKMRIGQLQLIKVKDRWILNFPTKKHWRGASKLEFIEAGLKKFAQTYHRRGIHSVAFPALGCGHGGLKWQDVEPLMRRHLERLTDLEIYFCLGQGNGSKPRRTGTKRGSQTDSEPPQRDLWP